MPYFVPDRFSPLLSEGGGGIYFSISPFRTEDLTLRVLCGRACLLMQKGLSPEQSLAALDIENTDLFFECFRGYTGMSPEGYALWLRRRAAEQL